MKNICQGLLLWLYIVQSNAVSLRARSGRRADPSNVTTTTNPIINAILDVETHLNNSVQRYNAQLNSMNSTLLAINRTLKSWKYNIEVLENGSKADLMVIANNTELIKKTNASSSFKLTAQKSKKYFKQLLNLSATQKKYLYEITGESPPNASNSTNASGSNSSALLLLLHTRNTSNTSAASGGNGTSNGTADGDANGANPEKSDLESRLTKVKSIYFLNGSKIEHTVKTLEKIERSLMVNSSIVTERILRRVTDDELAEIPREMGKQLDAAMNPTTTTAAPANASNASNSTNATSGGGALLQQNNRF